MLHKKFLERFNKELDAIGLPETRSERIEALAKLVHISKFKAEAILDGAMLPEEPLLSVLAGELEVNADWLIGKDDSKS